MSTLNIEYAGGVSLPNAMSRRGILARAPAWWRKLAERSGAASAEAAASAVAEPPAWHYGSAGDTPKPSRRFCGWLSGCVAPSVAVPCFNHADKLTVREQFTPACWERVLDQWRRDEYPISLRHRHDGVALASTSDITLTFDVDRVCGLLFDAKLRDDPLSRSIVQAASGKGLAVSIGYRRGKGWTVERDCGTVRVVDECVVDHVAVLTASQTPAYSGARCFGAIGGSLAPPGELRKRARFFAWDEIKRQAGVKR